MRGVWLGWAALGVCCLPGALARAWVHDARASSGVHVLDGEDVCAPLPAHATPADACAHVRAECAGTLMGSYLALYYCVGVRSEPAWETLRRGAWTAAAAVWLLILFSALGLVASNFFCPNLNVLADRLGMSDSLVGVTFLALGNGFPDVISTFRAMQKDAGSMALGELTGAAVITIAVVCGSIMVFYEFQLPAYVFVRDVGMYAFAVALLLWMLRDNLLGLFEGVVMLLLYVLYVAIVLWGDLWARPQSTSDEQSPLLGDLPRLPTASELEAPQTPHLAKHSLLTAMDVCDLSMRLQVPEARPIHISGELAEHFVDPTWSLRLRHGYLRRMVPSVESWHRTRPELRHSGTSDFEAVPTHAPRLRRLASESGYGTLPATSSRAALSTLAHGPPSAHRQSLPRSESSVEATEDVAAKLAAVPLARGAPSLCLALKIALLPSLTGWQSRSPWNRVVSIVNIPALFVLRLTVPLISTEEFDVHEAFTQLQHYASEWSDSTTCGDDITTAVNEAWARLNQGTLPAVHTHERVEADYVLMALQCAATPPFVLYATGLGTVWHCAACAAIGCLAGVALWRHCAALPGRYEPERLQLYARVRSLVGFGVGLLWVVVTVDQVLALLRTFGYVFGWSEAVLGLTVFAMGNSLGDVLTNLSIARLGHPVMAFTACFASPLTNLLLGTGLAATWLEFADPAHGPYLLRPSAALQLNCATLFIMLSLLLGIIPMNHFRVSRKLGVVFLVGYACVVTLSVVIGA